MAVGKSSLVRASKGLANQKTIDKKAVLENVICDADISSIKYTTKKADEKLIKSIETYGVISPVIAVKDGENLVVIDGAKRIDALKTLNQATVKAVIVSGNLNSLKKEVSAYKVEKLSGKAVEEKKVEEDLHEVKFKAVSGVYTELPFYLM